MAFLLSLYMQKRTLGSSDLKVAPLAFGGNVFGWTINENTSFQLLDAFIDKGFNLVDTADIYCQWATGVGGESETIIGKWLKQSGKRNKVVLATKCGMVDMKGTVNITKRYIIESAERSLKRLQTDVIDLYQTHKDDEITAPEETLSAYDQLIKEGKVRWIGASNFSAKRLQQFITCAETNNLPRYQTLQPLYNLYDREVFEKELEPLCLKEKISVINYYALAAGFLSGKYRTEADASKSVRGARVRSVYLNARGMNILSALDEVAAQYNTSCSAVAVAWLMARPSVGAPIASATSLEQLTDLFHAAELSLSQQSIEHLNTASKW